MIINNLWECFYGDSYRRSGFVVPSENQKPEQATSDYCSAESPVDAEICKLAGHLGGIQNGMKIQITLKELLEVIPHKRRRSDSYVSLIRKLREDYDVELEIVKTKEME